MPTVILKDGQTVSNIAGTGSCTTPDGSWKQYWLKSSGRQWPQECCIKQCTTSATDGAHVHISDMTGYYILPMCHSCNTRNPNQRLPVNANSKAVLVLQQNTRGPGNCY